jgi:hypothetical protein
MNARHTVLLIYTGTLALLVGCAKPGADYGRAGGTAMSQGSGPAASGTVVATRTSSAESQKKMKAFAQDSDESNAAPTSMATFAAMADSQPDRYLIKNATVTVEAADVRKATTDLVQSVRVAKGYVSDMHEQTDGLGALTATMQVRVPYTVFDQSMQQLADLGKVLEKQVTAEDVTEEFVDTQAKVRNLKQTELRLLDHLSRTGRLSDTLLVEKELTRVRETVEQLEGRVRFLSHRIAFSTISVTLREKAKVQAMVPAESYSPAKEGSDAIRSLVEFGRGLLSMAIWVLVWTPVWLPIGYGLFVGFRASNRRWRAQYSGAPSPYGPYVVAPAPPSPPPATSGDSRP